MTIDNTLIAKLASKIQIPRDDEGRLLGFHDFLIADATGVRLPSKEATTSGIVAAVHWTLKAEAALRVMLAKEIINAASK